MTDPIDTVDDYMHDGLVEDHDGAPYPEHVQRFVGLFRSEVDRLRAENDQAWAINRVLKGTNERLAANEDRLRAENAALAAALEDIAGMLPVATTPDGIGVWIADAECCRMDRPCHQAAPSDTGEWCPVCVAEVAWCAWKMGMLGA